MTQRTEALNLTENSEVIWFNSGTLTANLRQNCLEQFHLSFFSSNLSFSCSLVYAVATPKENSSSLMLSS